jgi:prepilin-type N-terminal cleavage/methylation domain-containing protein
MSRKRRGVERRGFTLIELLVVLAIISILSTVVVGALNSVRATARDTQRITALREIVNAIEIFKSESGQTAPPHNTNPIGGCVSFCLSSLTDELVSSYISQIPLDPQYGNVAANGYRYCRADVSGNTSQYDIMMWNEKTSGWCNLRHTSNISGTACWTNAGVPSNGWCDQEI